MTTSTDIHDPTGDDLREAALDRLKKRRDFHAHLLVYTLVNGLVFTSEGEIQREIERLRGA